MTTHLDINIPRVHALAAGIRADAAAIQSPSLPHVPDNPVIGHYVSALVSALSRVEANSARLQQRLTILAQDGDTFAHNVSSADNYLGSALERQGGER